MKALTIHQPWAGLIVLGLKQIENRTQPLSYRGPLVIHAGKTMREAMWCAMRRGAFEFCEHLPFGWERNPAFECGAIVGRVTMTGCVDGRSRPCPSWWHQEDSYWYELANPVALTRPIPWRGAQGLFEIPDEVLRNASLPASAGYYQG